jgi:hypothetical protein
MPGNTGVEVHGARELRTTMRRMGVEGSNKALKEAHTNVAKFVEDRTRGRGTRQQVRAARALVAKGTARSAMLAIKNTGAVPFGIGAFMGASSRFGWYAARRYRNEPRRQFPEWVGNNWDLENGQGPYVIAEVIQERRDDIYEAFLDEMRKAAESLGLEFD